MTSYRVCWLGPTGKVEIVQSLSFDTDDKALLFARARLEREDDRIVGFELWRGTLRVHVEMRKPVTGPRRPKG